MTHRTHRTLIITLIILVTIQHLMQGANTKAFVEAPRLPDGLRTGMLDLVPGFEGVSSSGITYTVNEWGYRDDPIDWSKRHVIFFGDSTSFGLGIEHADTYSEVWERLAGHDWQAINTAVPGHGSITEYAELRDVLERGVRPEWIVIGYHVTDIRHNKWDNLDWESSEKYLDRIHTLASEHDIQMLILHMPREERGIFDYSEARQTLYDYATSRGIAFVSGADVYRDYLQQRGLTAIPQSFISDGVDWWHPGVDNSALLGKAIAGVIE